MSLGNRIKQLAAAAGMSLALAVAAPSEAEAQDMSMTPSSIDTIGDIDPASRLAVLGTNAAIHGTICGIVGAVEGRDGWADMAQCMLGATVQYAGMELGMYDVPALPGLALRVTETGTSMIENTLHGRGMFDVLHYEIGLFLIEIDTQRSEIDLFWRVFPVYGIIKNAIEGHDFDLVQTMSYQSVVFAANLPGRIDGRTTGNVMLHGGSPLARAHEFNHILQYVRFRILQNLMPDFLAFIEDDLHYRAGEDIAFFLFNLPGASCYWTTGDLSCRQSYFDLPELESYIMQTAQ